VGPCRRTAGVRIATERLLRWAIPFWPQGRCVLLDVARGAPSGRSASGPNG
jgi:hypothetical protein